MRETEKTTIHWSKVQHGEWNFHIAATSKGLVYIGSQNQPLDEVTIWAKKHFPGSLLSEDHILLQPYVEEIKGYLDGKREKLELPLDLQGTVFQRTVWKALCDIPYGETRTYSEIAESIDKPSAVRAVGTAIGANPVLMVNPCHRVVGKNGALTGFRGGLEMKKLLLELEAYGTNVNNQK